MRKALKAVLISAAVVGLSLAAFADLGFYADSRLDFEVAPVGFIPALSLELGWESPRFADVLTEASSIEFGVSIGNPNVWDFADDYAATFEADVAFGGLALGGTYEVTVDSNQLRLGRLVFAGWAADVALVWTPAAYAAITLGAELAHLMATPYVEARFDW